MKLEVRCTELEYSQIKSNRERPEDMMKVKRLEVTLVNITRLSLCWQDPDQAHFFPSV